MLARAFGSRVTGICPIPDLVSATVVASSGSGIGGLPAPLRLIEEKQERLNDRAAALVDVFLAHLGEVSEGFEWHTPFGDPRSLYDAISSILRSNDVVLIDTNDFSAQGTAAVAENVILTGGRPVIVCPEQHDWSHTQAIPQRMQVNWDGSREATRAIHDALPFLKLANHVFVVTVRPADQVDQNRYTELQEIVRHLQRHGVAVSMELIELPGDRSVESVLVEHSAEHAVELVVMGAYGGSWLREVFFGSSTDSIIGGTMVPVFLSH